MVKKNVRCCKLLAIDMVSRRQLGQNAGTLVKDLFHDYVGGRQLFD